MQPFQEQEAENIIAAPWELQPQRQWSLLELMGHVSAMFHRATQLAFIASGSGVEPDKILTKDECFDLGFKVFNGLAAECKELGLRTSLATCYKAMDALKDGADRLAWIRVQEFASDLLKQIQLELRSTMFLHATPGAAALLTRPLEGWQAVLDKFPRAQREIEEASKCLAMNRSTASVFHLMRIMEEGLKSVAWKLGIGYKPSWESYINEINRRIEVKHRKKGIQWKRDERFLAEVASHLGAVRVAWRNPTMHMERMYTPEEASDVYAAVKGFMAHLSTRITERPLKK